MARLCVLSALAFVFDPYTRAQSPIGQLLHPWDLLWVFGLLAAGVLVECGLRFGKANVEVAGLVALCSVAAMQAVALFVIVGASALVSIVVFVAVVQMCVDRGRAILQADRAKAGQ